MELLLLIIVGIVLIETTYLTFKLTKTNKTTSNDILLDTSVLIDGRIVEIARSGLVSSNLLVPRSVIRELQFMADKADHDKRERARYGLEIIEKLQQLPSVTLVVTDDGTTSEHGVDEQLIVLARRSGAKLCTIDYNLNKAARVQAVEVININELAHALRVNHLPGEKIDVELVQPGQDKKQAVGYLDDGTMVVVEDARDLIGKTTHVELTRVLQTAAGRMMFAKKFQTGTITEAKPRQFNRTTERRENTSKTRTQTSGKTTSSRPMTSPRKRVTPEDKLVDLANEKT
jgi:uncharacterized protein YacL